MKRNLITGLFACILAAALATAAPAAEAPRQVLPRADKISPAYPRPLVAAVMVNGCSGDVIQRGPKWSGILCAGHCVQGNLGNKAPVQFIDGTTSEAILLAVSDSGRDLCRFAVPTKDILGVCPLAVGTPDKCTYEFIGYPAESGNRQIIAYKDRCPFYYLLKPLSNPHAFSSWAWWGFQVDGGGAVPGCSGSGIYANGQLVSIVSRNNTHAIATQCFGPNPEQIAAFLRESDRNGCDKWNMGNWAEVARNSSQAPAPISTQAKSNHRLFECKNGRCILLPKGDEAPAPVPLPPPDVGHDNAPPPPDAHVVESNEPPERYDGHGRPPKDYRGPKRKAKHLIDDEAEIDSLKQEIGELRARQPEKGEPGEPGQPGKDFTPLPLKTVVNGPPGLLIVATAFAWAITFAFVFFGILLFGKIVGLVRGYATSKK